MQTSELETEFLIAPEFHFISYLASTVSKLLESDGGHSQQQSLYKNKSSSIQVQVGRSTYLKLLEVEREIKSHDGPALRARDL